MADKPTSEQPREDERVRQVQVDLRYFQRLTRLNGGCTVPGCAVCSREIAAKEATRA